MAYKQFSLRSPHTSQSLFKTAIFRVHSNSASLLANCYEPEELESPGQVFTRPSCSHQEDPKWHLAVCMQRACGAGTRTAIVHCSSVFDGRARTKWHKPALRASRPRAQAPAACTRGFPACWCVWAGAASSRPAIRVPVRVHVVYARASCGGLGHTEQGLRTLIPNIEQLIPKDTSCGFHLLPWLVRGGSWWQLVFPTRAKHALDAIMIASHSTSFA